MRALPEPRAATALARELGGVFHGPPDTIVVALGEPGEAVPGVLVMLRSARPVSGIALVDRPVEGACIVVEAPQRVFHDWLARTFPEARPPGVHPTAVIESELAEGVSVGPHVHVAEGARVGPHCTLMAGCVVGREVEIGAGTVLFPRVVVYPRVQIGQDCRIHAGVVLGGDGFGYEPGPEGVRKVPHVGRVVIEDQVEIGPNTTVDRAVLGETRIGRGTKLDNLVQVAHNVRIGAHSVVASQTGIAGSSTLGQGVQVGGQVGISDHVHIGDGARIGAGSGVMRDVPAGQTVLGRPARPIRATLRLWVLLDRMLHKKG